MKVSECIDNVLTGTFAEPGTAAILVPPNGVPESLGIPGPLNKKAKVALILNHIFSTMDEEVQFKFKDKFASSFVTLNQSTSWKGMRSWTKRMLMMKDWEDVKAGLKELPEWVDAGEVEGIWKNILLPHYSESIGIGYFNTEESWQNLKRSRLSIS